jgi:hypothetical protein
VAEGRTVLPRVQSHYALESVLEPLDMEHMRIPSTKANPMQTEAFYLEILEMLATRVVGLKALAKRAEDWPMSWPP